MEVKTLQEAMEFFLSNSSGSCTGKKEDGTIKELTCYPDAKEFFKES